MSSDVAVSVVWSSAGGGGGGGSDGGGGAESAGLSCPLAVLPSSVFSSLSTHSLIFCCLRGNEWCWCGFV